MRTFDRHGDGTLKEGDNFVPVDPAADVKASSSGDGNSGGGSSHLNSSKYDQKVVNNLKHIFDKYDKDGSRAIDRGEMESVMKEAGSSETQLSSSMFNAVDKDGSGEISFRELLVVFFGNPTPADVDVMIRHLPKPKEEERATEKRISETQREDMLAIFDFWDDDHDGFITVSELEDAMGGSGLSVREVRDMFARYDTNNSGGLDAEEFVEAMASMY